MGSAESTGKPAPTNKPKYGFVAPKDYNKQPESAAPPSEHDRTGRIEFLGLYVDAWDRAMPIKMEADIKKPNQTRKAVEALVSELEVSGSESGVVAIQFYNQCSWSSIPNDKGYARHGFIGIEGRKVCENGLTKRKHVNEGLRFRNLEGVINIIGGDWQNAVYRITLDPPRAVELHAGVAECEVLEGDKKPIAYAVAGGGLDQEKPNEEGNDNYGGKPPPVPDWNPGAY
jgi:hypothetical protein